MGQVQKKSHKIHFGTSSKQVPQDTGSGPPVWRYAVLTNFKWFNKEKTQSLDWSTYRLENICVAKILMIIWLDVQSLFRISSVYILFKLSTLLTSQVTNQVIFENWLEKSRKVKLKSKGNLLKLDIEFYDQKFSFQELTVESSNLFTFLENIRHQWSNFIPVEL